MEVQADDIVEASKIFKDKLEEDPQYLSKKPWMTKLVVSQVVNEDCGHPPQNLIVGVPLKEPDYKNFKIVENIIDHSKLDAKGFRDEHI